MIPIKYGFDRIRINVFFDCGHLLSRPELREPNKRGVIDVFDAYPSAKRWGYNSRIEVTAPTNKVFDIIENAIRDCNMSVPKYKTAKNIHPRIAISKVEIARDFICDKEYDAILLADRFMSVTGKKYTAKFTIYDVENDPHRRKTDPRLKEKIFSTRTGYWGNPRSFECAVYARYSKMSELPCVHTEWRIIGFPDIRKKTRINSIADMKNFDFEKFFEENDKKFIVYEDINYTGIGRWLKRIDGRRTLTERQKRSVGVAGQMFCRISKLKVSCKECRKDDCQSLACEIRSAAGLKQFLKENDSKIRNRKGEKLGTEKSRFFSRTAITIDDLLKYNT
ncbi:MAG: hypothetical protein A2V87_08575 [Deltaproteobacteria bacterium RBG_16_58_17]|nr:MAG: hypothetical protein A2V87_08575 [Deltaproteobacteria bacterium RBG_16_58_17]